MTVRQGTLPTLCDPCTSGAREADEAATNAVEQPKCKPLVGVSPQAVECIEMDELTEGTGTGSVEEVVLQQEFVDDPELCIPPIEEGGDRERLLDETMSDKSLTPWRVLVDRKEKGFRWKDGLLFAHGQDGTFQDCELLVLPTRFSAQVLKTAQILKTAHDDTGHLGHRKVLQMIKRRFVWPLLAKDVLEYCQSCVSCQKCSKASVRKAPMMERPILMEPFEQMAVDIVGPMSKAKGGFTHILTAVCMASRWPEAVPLKSTSAVAVAEGLVSIFGRTSIPLEILSDIGAQFTGNLLKELCKLLGIKQLRTTAYHPQTNGMALWKGYTGPLEVC